MERSNLFPKGYFDSGLLPYKHELATATDLTLSSCRRTEFGKASTARTSRYMIEVQG
jgi:hypothetical protein